MENIQKALESLNISFKGNIITGNYGQEYTLDRETGTQYIKPTQRKDGTFRKEIKIRPGFTPLEERKLYIPVHKRKDIEHSNAPTSSSLRKGDEERVDRGENEIIRRIDPSLQHTDTPGNSARRGSRLDRKKEGKKIGRKSVTALPGISSFTEATKGSRKDDEENITEIVENIGRLSISEQACNEGVKPQPEGAVSQNKTRNNSKRRGRTGRRINRTKRETDPKQDISLANTQEGL